MKGYHYLSSSLSSMCSKTCYVLRLDADVDPLRNLAGFMAVKHHFGAKSATDPRHRFKGHRLVVTADMQARAHRPRALDTSLAAGQQRENIAASDPRTRAWVWGLCSRRSSAPTSAPLR